MLHSGIRLTIHFTMVWAFISHLPTVGVSASIGSCERVQDDNCGNSRSYSFVKAEQGKLRKISVFR